MEDVKNAQANIPEKKLDPNYDFSGALDAAKSEYYSSPAQQALTGLESAASGATLGLSRFATPLYTTTEAVRAREEANPVTSFVGTGAGALATTLLTGGASAPAEAALLAKGLGPVAARALATAGEGAIFGAGNTISDLALGDTKINAQKILTDLGFGAAIGGGLGLLSKGLEALPALKKEAAEQAIDLTKPIQSEQQPLDQLTTEVPQSLKDIQEKVNQFQYMGQDFDNVPKLETLKEATSRLPDLQVPPTPLHEEALLGKTEQDRINALLKDDPKFEDSFNAYNNAIRAETDQKTNQAIQQLAQNHAPAETYEQAGERIGQTLAQKIGDEQKYLGKIFNEIGDIRLKEKGQPVFVNEYRDKIINNLVDAEPKLARTFELNPENGKIKWTGAKAGVTDEAYSAFKKAVNSADQIETLEDLRDVRKAFTEKIKYGESNEVNNQLNKLANSVQNLVDTQFEDALQKVSPDKYIKIGITNADELRGLYKAYAENRLAKQTLERNLGIAFDGKDFKSTISKPSERILNKIFQNKESIDAFKKIAGNDEFNKALADYLNVNKKELTVDGVLKSGRFGTFLKNEIPNIISQSDKPNLIQRIVDLNTVRRLVPDIPSANPSGTANASFELLKKFTSAHGVLDLIKENTIEKLQQIQARQQLEQKLQGISKQDQQVNELKKIVQRVTQKIDEKAKNIFEGARKAAPSAIVSLSPKEYEKKVAELRQLNNSTAMMNFMDSNKSLHQYAPNIAQDLNNSIVSAVNFLNSKIPSKNNFYFSKPLKPSKQEIYQFSKYYAVVNNPLVALDEVKSGTLTSESLQALQSVHPDLYRHMQEIILENIKPDVSLPYKTKISLSKFLGSPLDQSLTPDSIMFAQNALSANTMNQKLNNQTKVTLGGLKELNLQENTKTKTHNDLD